MTSRIEMKQLWQMENSAFEKIVRDGQSLIKDKA